MKKNLNLLTTLLMSSLVTIGLVACNNNSNDTSIRDGVKSLSISQLKFAYSELGSAFKPDSNNINNGYPILYWQ